MKPECSNCSKFPCMVAYMGKDFCPRFRPKPIKGWYSYKDDNGKIIYMKLLEGP